MEPSTRSRRRFTGVGLAWPLAGLLLALAPLLWPGNFALALLTQIGIASIACLAYNILLGQGGMLSFGHAVYTGLGSCLAIHALNAVSAGRLALPVSLVPLVGGLAGLGVALLLGFVSTRKSGTPFAMITLGLGELVAAAALMFPPLFGGEAGVSGNRVVGPAVLGISFGPQIEVYYLTAAYALVCTALMYAFTLTPLGRLLNAVRDNPERVEFIGHDPHTVRYLAFLVSGFFAGVAGGLGAVHFEIVTAEVVGAARSASYLLFTFLGGAGFFFGPVIGAVLMVLSTVLLSEWTPAWLLYLGLLFLLVVMHAPGGIASLYAQGWRWLRSGGLRGQVPACLALAAAAALALLGAGALIELLYRLQLDAVLGAELNYLGLSLSTSRAASWWGAGGVLLAGLGLSGLARRRLRRPRDAMRPGADGPHATRERT